MDPLFYFYVSVIFLVIAIPFCAWYLKVLETKPIIIPNPKIIIEETNYDDSLIEGIPNGTKDMKNVDLDNVSREVIITVEISKILRFIIFFSVLHYLIFKQQKVFVPIVQSNDNLCYLKKFRKIKRI